MERQQALEFAEMVIWNELPVSPADRMDLMMSIGRLSPEERERLESIKRAAEARHEQVKEESRWITRALEPLRRRLMGDK